MEKKYLIVGMAVILGASLSFFACEQDAKTETVTEYDKSGALYGSLTAAQFNAAIDAAIAEGRAVTLNDVTITGGGTLDLKTATVEITGTLKAQGAAIKAAAAAVTFADTATITGASFILGDSTVFTAEKVGTTQVAEPAEGGELPAEVPTGGVTAVETLTLGAATQIIAGLKVYVYGNLTVNATSAAPSGAGAKVFAIGTVTLAETNNTALADSTKVDVSGAVIEVSGTSPLTVTLPATVPATFALKGTDDLTVTGTSYVTASVEGTSTLTLASTTTSVTAAITGTGTVKSAAANVIADVGSGATLDLTATTLTSAAITGAGTVKSAATTVTTAAVDTGTTLTLTGEVTAATITGAGNVTLSNTAALSLTTASFGNTGTTTFSGTGGVSATPNNIAFAGDVIFAGDVTITSGATFSGNAVFKGDLTLTDGDAVFEKDAFFADTKAITLTADSSVITLKPGAELAHGAPTGIPTVYSAIIANFDESTDVTLTPAENTKLTFGATGAKSITQASSAETATAHGITIGGNATLVPSATYTVASAANTVGTLTVDDGGTLKIGAGLLTGLPAGTIGAGIDNDDATSSKLVLTGAATTAGAKLTGAGEVVAGKTTIIGGDDGWQAVAASGTPTVTIEKDSIAGSAAVALTAQDEDSAITVEAGETLTVDGVAVTLDTSKGKVTLTGAATGGAKLLLKGGTNAGSLVADSSKTGPLTLATTTTLTDSDGETTTTATVTGTGIAATGDGTIANGADLGTLKGGATTDTNDATITAPSTANDSAIETGWKIKSVA